MAAGGDDGPGPDDGAGGRDALRHGAKRPSRSEGAPWPPAESRSDGPERPGRRVPTAPDTDQHDLTAPPKATRLKKDGGDA